MNGFFQIRRKFFAHPLWEEERVFSRAEAFLDLLQLAAFVRTRRIVANAMIPLERGEVCASERYLSTRWKWSTSKVRAYLAMLEAERMIVRQKKQGITVIRLCNYERYNSDPADKKAQINHGESSEEAGTKQIEEGKEGEERGEARPRDAEEEKPLCTLEQALSYASMARRSPEAVRAWWHERNSTGWRKGGAGNPKIRSWQSDLAGADWAEEKAAKAKQSSRTKL